MKFKIKQHINKLFYVYMQDSFFGITNPFSWILINRLSNLPKHHGGYKTYKDALTFSLRYKEELINRIPAKNKNKSFKDSIIDI